MKTTEVRVILSKNSTHLVFIQNHFDDDGFLIQTKKSAMPISPGFDPTEVLKKAQTLAWEIYGEPDSEGFCKVRKVEAAKEKATGQEVKQVSSSSIREVENHSCTRLSQDTVLVIEAELALAQVDYNSTNRVTVVNPANGKPAWPVLISTPHDCEYPEEGDYYYDASGGGHLRAMTEDSGDSDSYSVLALPKHFSSKHLADISSGLMKPGDKLLVECFKINRAAYIKYDALNHVILQEYTPEDEERETTAPGTIADNIVKSLPNTANWSAGKLLAVIAFIWLIMYTCEEPLDSYEKEIETDTFILR